MKITKLLFLAISILLLSCSEDEDPLPTEEGMLGTWIITDLTYSGSTTTTVAGISPIKADFTGFGKDMDLTTTFNADPNTVTSEGSYTIEITTTVLGMSETEEVEFEEAIMDGTWELNGKTLTVTNPGGTQEGTIVSQTSTSMKIKVSIDQTESGAGYTVRTRVNGTYTFVKQ